MPSDGSNKVIKHIHTKTTEKNKNKEQTYATLENICTILWHSARHELTIIAI